MSKNNIAKKKGISMEESRKIVSDEFKSMSQKDMRWYSPSFWFEKLGLGSHVELISDLKHHLKLYPETLSVLKNLKEKFTLIVITSNTTEFVDIKMEAENIGKFFSGVYSITDLFNGAKSKKVFESVMKEIGIDGSEMVHIGDDPQFDYLEARKSGANAFLVERGDQPEIFRKHDYMKKVNPDHVIKDLRELSNKIEELGW